MRRRIATRGTCVTEKKRFADHKSAAAFLALIRTQLPKRDKTPVRCYECDLCHGHHLTSQTEEEYGEGTRR
jgi:hypothetical protein